jgi:hypothetical protein
MANAITPITRQFSVPYLTVDEFKAAPTALDYGNLVQGGSAAAQDAELANAITRASSYIDGYCNQIIGATLDTERQRVRVRPDGSIRFHPELAPIVALTDLQIGFNPNAMQAMPDPSIAWLEKQQIVFPYGAANLTWSSQGPIAFGSGGGGRAEVFLQYTYVNGYTNTIIAADVSAGATTLTVGNGEGITAGQSLKIYDGFSTENVTVASTYTFGSETVPLVSALLYSHTSGVSISALPAAIKEAAILVTSAYLKIRGDASLTLAVTNRPGQELSGAQMVGSDIAHANELLKPFMRVR